MLPPSLIMGRSSFTRNTGTEQVGIHNFGPFVEGVVFIFRIGADSYVVYQPVYMARFFFDPGYKFIISS